MQSDMKVVANAAQKKPRDTSVELYRVSLMFGICFLHCITQSGLNRHLWLGFILRSCVDGFVFITGFYGLKFKLSKLLGLFAIAIYCGLFAFAVEVLSGMQVLSFDYETIRHVKRLCLHPWFLIAYAFLMCMAPMVDAVLDKMEIKSLPRLLAPVLLLIFLWSFLSQAPVVGLIMPPAEGFQAYSGMTLLGVYMAARLCRRVDFESLLTLKRLVLLLCVSFLFTGMLRCGEYNSPFAVILAASFFAIFRKISVPTWIGRCLLILGPSMFSVYLMHSDSFGFHLIKQLAATATETYHLPILVAYGLTALCIFGGCVIADVPRRVFVCALKRPIAWLFGVIDSGYDKIVNGLLSRLK